MILVQNQKALPFIVEDCAYEGVKRIAVKVAADVEKVSGVLPQIIPDAKSKPEKCLLFATLGHSRLIDKLVDEGKLNTSVLSGKREVFFSKLVDAPFEGVEQALVICGSDKLGTIYGMFMISEYIGVSPMCYFGDAEPERDEAIVFAKDIEKVSKEPSVKYRGFFINDEWPCFGNWTFGHFGGFTAEMYDYVFEFLLRMRGNYLWPAMWSSSFPLDGPGGLSEELADIYGITISYSHHEPCLRASEEWDLVRGEDSPYGNEWNYYTNSEGLSRYWADALKRSGKYNHMITIGMRGERDSSMLGENATLKDNIDLLKDIITKQRQLIAEYVNEDVDSVPQLLALYKEVEAYFYGDENTEGLKEWKELENVVFMLCEDNFGHMRTLPTEEMRSHKGGFGMYYHLDYHGGPVSYEWMPSTPLTLIWEQMTQAYEYGIKDVWVVNVGDLKGNEVALSYFLALAYDFDRWGTKAPGSYKRYMGLWAEHCFPRTTPDTCEEIVQVYEDMVKLNFMRRPEALHCGIYHPCHYNETDRILALCADLEKRNEELYEDRNETEKLAYYSMLYFPVKASINLIRMHLYAGKNAHYATQGRKIANLYGKLMNDCILEDKRLCEEFGAFRDGKWKGMELEKHIGFTSWNDDGWKYPVRMYVEPVDKPRMSVSRADDEKLFVKVYGEPRCIDVHDFLYEGEDKVVLEISNDGADSLNYKITVVGDEMPDWLTVSPMKGEVADFEQVVISCDRQSLPKETQTVRMLISDGDTKVAVEVKAKKEDTNELPAMTFLDVADVITMEAHHYSEKKDVEQGGFVCISDYGRSGNGVKVFPCTSDFAAEEEKPEITYTFKIENAGKYQVELWTTPTNSLQNRRPLQVQVSAKDNSQSHIVTILDENYRGGENSDAMWCKGALDQIRITKTEMEFDKGIQSITIGAMQAGLVLERVILYPVQTGLKESYLGPKESAYIK